MFALGRSFPRMLDACSRCACCARRGLNRLAMDLRDRDDACGQRLARRAAAVVGREPPSEAHEALTALRAHLADGADPVALAVTGAVWKLASP